MIPTFVIGTIRSLNKETTITQNNAVGYIQELALEVSQESSRKMIIVGSEEQPLQAEQRYRVGQRVVLAKTNDSYAIVDTYRLPALAGLFIAFVFIVLLFTQKKGVSSLVSLAITITLLFSFTVPQILHGSNPLIISLITSLTISVVTVLLSHGYSATSRIIFFCMSTTLLFVSGLSFFVVKLAQLTGFGNEEVMYLQFSSTISLNLQGLLLGGIMLATLSVLDDSVVSQVSVVEELHHTNPTMSFRELYKRGMEVGKNHVSTLVNTLVLAYAGSSLPLFLLFIQSTQPLWVVLNDQMIAEEIVRTLTGSIGLVLSIPLSTYIAARFFAKHR
ncbi:MAG: YibE/F family protein [Candidatus Pacebacteria bacterium]|nr:YibE/F family protein [Candidatus Paceibacterota bacterium]